MRLALHTRLRPGAEDAYDHAHLLDVVHDYGDASAELPAVWELP